MIAGHGVKEMGVEQEMSERYEVAIVLLVDEYQNTCFDTRWPVVLDLRRTVMKVSLRIVVYILKLSLCGYLPICHTFSG